MYGEIVYRLLNKEKSLGLCSISSTIRIFISYTVSNMCIQWLRDIAQILPLFFFFTTDVFLLYLMK